MTKQEKIARAKYKNDLHEYVKSLQVRINIDNEDIKHARQLIKLLSEQIKFSGKSTVRYKFQIKESLETINKLK